jgi:hypothetical protein
VFKLHPPTLSEVSPCFFLSCKANTRVQLIKTGHGPHCSQLVVCCFMYCLCRLCCSMRCLCRLCCSMYRLCEFCCSMYCLCLFIVLRIVCVDLLLYVLFVSFVLFYVLFVSIVFFYVSSASNKENQDNLFKIAGHKFCI